MTWRRRRTGTAKKQRVLRRRVARADARVGDARRDLAELRAEVEAHRDRAGIVARLPSMGMLRRLWWAVGFVLRGIR